MAQETIRFAEEQALFEKGLTKVYRDEVKVAPNTYKEWLREEKATDFFKTDFSVSGLGVMPEKGIGDVFQKDRIKYGAQKTFTMKTYGLSLVVQYEVFRWELHGVFRDVGRELAKTATTRYELVAYGLPNNAFSTSSTAYTDFQGEAFCANAHTRMDGGTWKNRPDTDLPLSMLAVQTATTDIRKTVNHRGIYMNLTPRKLMTGIEQQWLAQTLLFSDYNPENGNMAHNNAKGYNLSLSVSPYITSSTAWWLICDKADAKIQMGLGDSPDLRRDNEPQSRNMLFSSYCSFRLEVYEGRGWYGSPGT